MLTGAAGTMPELGSHQSPESARRRHPKQLEVGPCLRRSFTPTRRSQCPFVHRIGM